MEKLIKTAEEFIEDRITDEECIADLTRALHIYITTGELRTLCCCITENKFGLLEK